MSRRSTAAVCLALGLLCAPGVASADPGWPPFCQERGEPPCHTTTTTTTTTAGGVVSGTSATATTTTAAVSGTSAVATTTDGVAVTGVTSGQSPAPSTALTTTTPTTTAAPAAASVAASPQRRVASSGHALADTGAASPWAVPAGLAALLAGTALVVFTRRRRA